MADNTASMVSAVTADTFQNAVFNAGVLLHDIDISTVTDAAALLTLITKTENKGKWFGATQGGVNIQEKSHPSRGAWIEIRSFGYPQFPAPVAPLAGCVG